MTGSCSVRAFCIHLDKDKKKKRERVQRLLVQSTVRHRQQTQCQHVWSFKMGRVSNSSVAHISRLNWGLSTLSSACESL